MPNSLGLDQTPRSAASDLGLHCLPRLSFRILRDVTVNADPKIGHS